MNLKKQVIVIGNMKDNTYFFSKDHCQEHGLGDEYVPCTHFIPCNVTPRKTLPDGIIKCVQDLVAVFYDNMKEIPNPDVRMQPFYSK